MDQFQVGFRVNAIVAANIAAKDANEAAELAGAMASAQGWPFLAGIEFIDGSVKVSSISNLTLQEGV